MLTIVLLAALVLQVGDHRGVGVGSAASAPTESSDYRRRHAIVVGIDQYEDPSYPDLQHAAGDARSVAQLLIAKHGFAESDVRLLINGQATRRALTEALEDWASTPERVELDDVLVVYFAGHGVNRELGGRGTRGYLVPVDGRTGAAAVPQWSTLIGMDDLASVSETIPAKHALFVLDCCFGGLSITREMPSGVAGMRNRARQVLTAGTGEQAVLDSGGGTHSVFASAFLQALDGAADGDGDRVVSFGELYSYVARNVESSTHARQTPLQGTLPDHEGGNIAFFVRQTPDSNAPRESRSQAHAEIDGAGTALLRSLVSESGLRIVPRAEWGARDPNPARMDPMGNVTRITIHHSGEVAHGVLPPEKDPEPDPTAEVLRAIQRAHMDREGCGDIGYHFAVDPTGQVWECRSVQYQGAHAGRREDNEGNLGIVVLGNFEKTTPSPLQLTAVLTLVAFLRNRYEIEQSGVLMHSQLRETACPGAQLANIYRGIFDPASLAARPDLERLRLAANGADANPDAALECLRKAGVLVAAQEGRISLTVQEAIVGATLTESGRSRLLLIAELVRSDDYRDSAAWIVGRDPALDVPLGGPRGPALVSARAGLNCLVVDGGIDDGRCVIVGRAGTDATSARRLEIVIQMPFEVVASMPPGETRLLTPSIEFAPWSDALTDDARAAAHAIATDLSATGSHDEIWIAGYSDATAVPADSPFESQRGLSTARAMAVLRLMVSEVGVPAERCSISAHGKYSPASKVEGVVVGANRVEIRVVKR